MTIRISKKFLFLVVGLISGAIVVIGIFFFLVGYEAAMEILYETSADFFKYFLRLPERKVV